LLRKCCKIVWYGNVWCGNILLESVIYRTLVTFEAKLDKFWLNQDIVYNFEATIAMGSVMKKSWCQRQEVAFYQNPSKVMLESSV